MLAQLAKSARSSSSNLAPSLRTYVVYRQPTARDLRRQHRELLPLRGAKLRERGGVELRARRRPS